MTKARRGRTIAWERLQSKKKKGTRTEPHNMSKGTTTETREKAGGRAAESSDDLGLKGSSVGTSEL